MVAVALAAVVAVVVFKLGHVGDEREDGDADQREAADPSFLDEHALLDALDAEWYVDAGEGKEKGCKGRELRPQYEQAVNRPKPKKKGKKAE